MTYDSSYNNQGPGGYQPARPRVERKVVGGWTCAQYGGDPTKEVQYEVTEIPLRNGGHFFSVEFFKNYTKRDGTIGRSFNFPATKLRQLVEKINHYLMTYETGQNRGCYVFQPMPQQQPQPQVQPGYAPQQYSQPLPGYQAPPTQPAYGAAYGAPQQHQQLAPQQPQQGMVATPPPPGSGPSW